MDRRVDVAIIGAGTAGLAALAKVRASKRSFVLINGGELGTTCARVGCMPSKVAVQVAEDFHRRRHFDRIGIAGKESLQIDTAQALEHVRDLRDIFVDRVLAGTTDNMSDEFIEGYAEFIEPHVLKVGNQTVHAKKIVIATGSRPLIPQAWEKFRDRIFTTDNLFEQESLPSSIAVIGLGVIGLELGQALKRMGVDVTGIDRLECIGGLQDPVVNRLAIEIIGQELTLWLGHRANVEEEQGKLRVRAGKQGVLVDKLLVSLGRVPILESLRLDRLGCEFNASGMPKFDPNTMQVGDLPVFIAGDVTGTKAILHEAADEGRIAGYNAAHDGLVAFKRRTPLTITFCDPNIATVGASWTTLDHDATAVGEMRLGPLGRALIMGKNKGVLRVYAEEATGKIVGAAMVAPRGENLAHLLAWSIQQGLTAFDLLKMPYYHPTIEEALQAALQDLVSKLDAPPPGPFELERLQKT